MYNGVEFTQMYLGYLILAFPILDLGSTNRKPPFFNQKFSTNDICNCVSTGFFNFKIKFMEITN
jgi:hypothetical protein